MAGKWEAQAQDSLAQNERLKDLLEESATWSAPAAPAAPEGSSTEAAVAAAAAAHLAAAATSGPAAGAGTGGGAAGGGGGGDSSALAALCQRFERDLLLEKARSAQLDVQVRWGRHGARNGGRGSS